MLRYIALAFLNANEFFVQIDTLRLYIDTIVPWKILWYYAALIPPPPSLLSMKM